MLQIISLSGLQILINLFNPSFIFLQEVCMTTEQLLVAVGCNFKGISKIDPNDSRRPGNAVVWRTSIENVVVSNIVTSRLQLIKTDQLGSFVNIYSPSGSQGERERCVLFNQDLFWLETGIA